MNTATDELTGMRRRRQLGSYLNELGLTGQGVEVGVEYGRNAERILSSWTGHTLYLVDPWRHVATDYTDGCNRADEEQEQVYQSCMERLDRYYRRIEVYRMTSAQAAADPGIRGELDFCYIDANHAYEFVSQDLTLWFPKIKSGGLMSGHDYLDGTINGSEYGVKRAVDEFAKQIGVTVSSTRERYPTWYFRKP